jgi:nitroreductase
MTERLNLMSILETIYSRRSVRSYDSASIDQTTIQTLLAAAVQAPTAIYQEPWAFAILQDKSALKRLSDLAKPLFVEEVHRAHLDQGGHALEIFTRPDFNIFYDAGTLIVICAKPEGPFVVADCWLAAENLMLTACALGLGTCIIGSALPALNSPEGKAELRIPAEYEAIAPIIVGVPHGQTPPVPRKEPVILAWK